MKHIFSRCRCGIKSKYPAMMDSGPRFDWRSNQIATPALRAVVAIFFPTPIKTRPRIHHIGVFCYKIALDDIFSSNISLNIYI